MKESATYAADSSQKGLKRREVEKRKTYMGKESGIGSESFLLLPYQRCLNTG